MKQVDDSIQVTPQQIKRYVLGYRYGSLKDAKDMVEMELQREVDPSSWVIWEKNGLRKSDLASDEAQAIAMLIREYEKGSLILDPLEVRTWRKDMGFSQPEASEFLGVTRATWSRWEQLGIIDRGAGIAAHALAASVTSKDPSRLAERAKAIREILELHRATSRFQKKPVSEAMAISQWWGQVNGAPLGLGTYGLYQLLREAWETEVCGSCGAKNPDKAKFCSSCGSSLNSAKEVTQSK